MRLFVIFIGMILSFSSIANNDSYKSCIQFKKEISNSKHTFPKKVDEATTLKDVSVSIKDNKCLVNIDKEVNFKNLVSHINYYYTTDSGYSEDEVIELINSGFLFGDEYTSDLKSKKEDLYISYGIYYKDFLEKETFHFTDARIKPVVVTFDYKESK